MLNLVHQETVDEKVYERLSERMRNRYDLFGGLPDTIKDDWIDDIETLGEKMDQYINAQPGDRLRPALQRHDEAQRRPGAIAAVLSRRDLAV